MLNKRQAISLVLITFFCWCTYAGYDKNFFYIIKPVYKHLINFSLIAGVALTGYYGLKKHTEQWVLPLWVTVYAIVISVLLLLGITDIFLRINNFSFREFLFALRMIFTSPVPYGIIILLAKKFRNKTSTQNI